MPKYEITYRLSPTDKSANAIVKYIIESESPEDAESHVRKNLTEDVFRAPGDGPKITMVRSSAVLFAEIILVPEPAPKPKQRTGPPPANPFLETVSIKRSR